MQLKIILGFYNNVNGVRRLLRHYCTVLYVNWNV